MLRVRKEQIDHFRDKGRAKYKARLAEYLEREHAAEVTRAASAVKAVGGLEAFVERAFDKALAYGFVIELETTQLVLLLLRFGLDADTRLSWFGEILRDRYLIPIGKARRLVAVGRSRPAPEGGGDDIDSIDITQPEGLS
ncbi:MAG: hypothetical protein U0271_32285 [Polyangiaceae bacterium]